MSGWNRGVFVSFLRRFLPSLSVACISVAGSFGWAKAHDPDALWRIVHERCVMTQEKTGHASPCEEVHTGEGYAVLKSIEGRAQYLLIPTARVPGMESPVLLDPAAPDYFSDAWKQAWRVGKGWGVRLPREDVALTINSQDGRSQNQLHIHVSCLKPEVKVALWFARNEVSSDWRPLPVSLAGHSWRAMRVDGAELEGVKPFLRLSASLKAPEQEMAYHTLAVVPEIFDGGKAGFILLDDTADPSHGDHGSAEDLQDHACTLVTLDPAVVRLTP
ncbi:MAG: CDP-diacylglycerol diphosphatase [Acetobacter sp.]|jgi:CDP-diacylglycerol pyrophosphatase